MIKFSYKNSSDLDANQAIALAFNVVSYNGAAYARKFGQQVERLMAPLLNNQAMFQYNENGDCVGVLTYGNLSGPQIMIHANDHRALQVHEVVNGDRLFVLDCYADLGNVDELLRNFARTNTVGRVEFIRNGKLETM